MSEHLSPPLDPPAADSNRPVWSVSELSQSVRLSVEDAFSHVRVRGEISGLHRAASGHVYLDLKDEKALLNAVCWKGQDRRWLDGIEDGMDVIASGRMTTYAGRSRYQLVIETMTPAGRGAILAMLEKRRKKLEAEGLFDPRRKKPLPFLPRRVGVITSASGAAIRDILQRFSQRFEVPILLWPVPVQGEDAPRAMIQACEGFQRLPEDQRPDVLILARGGGSFEDLLAFYDEDLVRAVAAAAIPIISAVGHESDTTLCDHAADHRAPTPTAAVEAAVPVRAELIERLTTLRRRLRHRFQASVELSRRRWLDAANTLRRITDLASMMAARLENLNVRMGGIRAAIISEGEQRWQRQAAALSVRRLREIEQRCAERRAAAVRNLIRGGRRYLESRNLGRRQSDRLLQGLSYRHTLKRGYAVIRQAGRIITRAARLQGRRSVEIQFHDRSLSARIENESPSKKRSDPPKDDAAQQGLFPGRR